MANLHRVLGLWRRRSSSHGLERLARILPTAIYMVMMTALSHVQGKDIPTVIDDRVGHLIEFFILGILLMFSAAGFAAEQVGRSHLAAVVGIGILYALLDEWHQRFVPGRDSSLRDIGFDVLGLLSAVAVVVVTLRREKTAS